MPGSKRKSEEVVDVYQEFVRSEVARQVIRNETALLEILENLSAVDGHLKGKIQKAYFQIHKNSLLCDEDLAALSRFCEVLNVLSGRAAIRPDSADEW